MSKITNFTEAAAAMRKLASLRDESKTIQDSIDDFLTQVKASIDTFALLKGSSPTEEKDDQSIPPAEDNAPKNGAVPATVADRVLYIVRDAGMPIMPKDIVKRYEELGWPKGAGKLYDSISASISYLTTKKRSLTRSSAGYEVADE